MRNASVAPPPASTHTALSGSLSLVRHPELPARPARRVYHDDDVISTSPDFKLGAAFESTQPGVRVGDWNSFEDEPTLEWVLPALGLLVVGFFVGRWWMSRKPKDGAVSVVAGDRCGFDELGCD